MIDYRFYMRKPSFPSLFQLFVFILLLIIVVWSYRKCYQQTFHLTTSNGCQQSLIESDGFICEPDSAWYERKYIYFTQEKENMIRRPNTYYFEANWEPNFHCSHARRIGVMGDGGKWICDLYRLKSRHDCLIYSVGSSGDFSFEIDMKKAMPHCEIHSFDQGLYQCPTNTCSFHQIRFGDGIHVKNSKTWLTIINELKHSNRFIDILKIDIEGEEFSVFPHIFNSDKNTWPRQIQVELHPMNVTVIHEFFDLMRKNNYVIFNKENNVPAGPYFFEYAFLKLNPQFFIQTNQNKVSV